jgi:hypothetical protein
MAESRFLRESAEAKKPWMCIDWLLKAENLTKVEEGKYSGGLYDANAPPRPETLPGPDEILREYFGHNPFGADGDAIDTVAEHVAGGTGT